MLIAATLEQMIVNSGRNMHDINHLIKEFLPCVQY